MVENRSARSEPGLERLMAEAGAFVGRGDAAPRIFHAVPVYDDDRSLVFIRRMPAPQG